MNPPKPLRPALPPPPPSTSSGRTSETIRIDRRPSSIPPSSGIARPSTIPPRTTSSYPPRQESLVGASGIAVRFRPVRVNTADLGVPVSCRAVCDDVEVGPLRVIDVGATGFAAALSAPSEPPTAGAVLDSLELCIDGEPVWFGRGLVVHASTDRLGVRFTSGLFDMDVLRIEATIEQRLSILREQQRRLPDAWRASVGDLRHLLESAKLEIEAFERTVVQDPIHHGEDEAKVFEGLRARWGGAYFSALEDLFFQSKELDPENIPYAQSYAAAALLPLVLACPMHRRAYEKPLGYAGDFRLMEMHFTNDLMGDGMFGRFLHSISQRHSLAQSVIARERVMREAVIAAAATPGEGPVRILSVAAGPAIELRKFLGSVTELRRPLQLLLLDQDEAAHEAAHRRVTRILVEQHHGRLPVNLECLHFSVRQLLLPRNPSESAVRDSLANLDLVYSAGLYDYLTESVARRLTEVLYGRLRPGGRLLVGNLSEMSDTSWMLNFVLSWHLIYRDEPSMLALGRSLAPVPQKLGITRDETGHCLFLDVIRPL